jgi:hypothetical protein
MTGELTRGDGGMMAEKENSGWPTGTETCTTVVPATRMPLDASSGVRCGIPEIINEFVPLRVVPVSISHV